MELGATPEQVLSFISRAVLPTFNSQLDLNLIEDLVIALTAEHFLSPDASYTEHTSTFFKEISKTNFILPNGPLVKYAIDLIEASQKRRFIGSDIVQFSKILTLVSTLQAQADHNSTLCTSIQLICNATRRCWNYSSLPHSITGQVQTLQEESDTQLANGTLPPQFCDDRDYGESYRYMPILPYPGEVLYRSRVPLRCLPETGVYPNAEVFLDVHFKLLREDMVRPIRDGVSNFWDEDLKFKREMYAYSNVRMLETRCDNRKGILYQVSFLPYGVKDITKIRWDRSKRLMYGTLLCIFPMDSVHGEDVSVHDPLWAVVINKDDKKLFDACTSNSKKYPNITIQFFNGFEPLFSYEKSYFMLESRKVYFEAYKHTLTVLQNMIPSSLPFQRILLGYSHTADLPRYLQDNSTYVMSDIFPNLRTPAIDILGKWPSTSPILDESQYRAVKLALTNEIAVIQGPPGTGKTYVGTHVMKILLQTRNRLNELYNPRSRRSYNMLRNQEISSNILCRKPILVITYTNHALDQFLASLLEFQSQIIRIGSRSEDERIKELSLRNKTDLRCGTLNKSEKDNLTAIMENITKRIQYCSRRLALSQLTDRDIQQYTTQTQYNCLTQHPKYTLSNWYNCVDLVDNPQLLPPIQNAAEFVPNEEVELNYDIYSDSDNEDAVDFDEDFVDYKSDEEFLTQCEISEDYGRYPTLDMFQRDNLWQLSIVERHNLIDNWNSVKRRYLSEEMERLQSRYIELRDILNEHFKQIEYTALRKAAVVGMTTTGAAKYSDIISELRPHIIFIEEAAEVLEANVIACLSKQVQHLILIGDHQQLKPSFAEYSLRKYNINQSLFERLVNNHFEHVQLNCQHRMRPEISQLVKHIYPNLTDHHSVLSSNNVLGVKYNMYFLDHKINENHLDREGLSKSNSHEAKFLAQFASYLLKQGYSTSEITILTFYEAQRFNIKDELVKISKLYHQIRVSTVDKYQGEENRIILFSVVRSNKENNIGHCREDNRVCVALSRAKEGLFIIGNSQCLREGGKRSGLWDKILDTFDNKVGNTLPLQCQNHPAITTKVSRAEDFKPIKEGGCQLPCDQSKPCGHKCLLKCHPYSHEEIKCEELCDRVKECGHLCFRSDGMTRKTCFEECGTCNAKVKKNLEQCGHEMILVCTEHPFHELCRQKCEKTLACGHNCRGRCGEDCTKVLCLKPCERTHDCGHPCVKEDGKTIRKCYQICNDCQFRVEKTLGDCGHVISLPCSTPPLHSLCKQPCSKVLACGHPCERFCGESCTLYPCSKPCSKVLPCSHTCANPCNTACTVKCVMPCEKKKLCGHPCVNTDGETPKPCYEACGDCNYLIEREVPNCKHKMTVPCARKVTPDICTSPCDKILDCGHKCAKQCNEDCSVDCDTSVLKALDCGHETMLPCSLKIDETFKCLENVNIPLICGHILTTTCFNRSQLDLKNLDCTKPCNFLLPCDHYCLGLCTGCIYGSDHVPCKRTCDRTLICGHKCEELCHEGVCAPCTKKCENWCPHKACNHPCGTPCLPCFKECVWSCRHIQCNLPCSEPCKRLPCEYPCSRKLRCGHQCIGACGEPCPNLCRRCNRENSIFKDNERNKESRFLLLEDCKHVFEMKSFEAKWIISKAQPGDSVTLSVCPLCQVPIRNNLHFSSTIKAVLQGINAIKCHIIEEFKMSCTKNCRILQDTIQELAPSLYLQTIEDWLREIDRKVETFEGLKLPYLHSLISLLSRIYSHPSSLYQGENQPQIHSTFLNDKTIRSFLRSDEFHFPSDQMHLSNLAIFVDKCEVLALFSEFRDTSLQLEESDSTLLDSYFQRFSAHLQNPLDKGKEICKHFVTCKLFLYKLTLKYGVISESDSHLILLRPANCHLNGWFFCKMRHPFFSKDVNARLCIECNQ